MGKIYDNDNMRAPTTEEQQEINTHIGGGY